MTLIRTLFSSILLLLLFGTPPASGAELSVFAASSLTEALRELARVYQTEHPGERLLLNFAGSQTLATQIEQGAPVDLFVSADPQAMERLQNQGLVDNPRPLLRNRLVLAARPDLKPQLTTLEDLARPNLLLTVGNHRVPVGRYTRQLFNGLAEDSGYGAALVKKIGGNIVSEENRVKAIVAKLLLGETDAGIVYRSDLASGNASRLTAIPLPKEHNPQAVYPLAKLRGAKAGVDRFVDFLFNSTAQHVFARYGFSPGGTE